MLNCVFVIWLAGWLESSGDESELAMELPCSGVNNKPNLLTSEGQMLPVVGRS